MADAVVHTIKNFTKIEALIGSLIVTMVGLMNLKFQMGLPIDIIIVSVLVILIVLLVLFQLLYYLKFIIEKSEWRKDQICKSDVMNSSFELELRKLDIEREIMAMKCMLNGINTTAVNQ